MRVGRCWRVGWCTCWFTSASHLRPMNGRRLRCSSFMRCTGDLSEPAEKILVARWSGSEKRGTAFGWYHLAVGVAALPASAVFGWLWTESR